MLFCDQKEDLQMLRYKIDVIEALTASGYTSYRIRKEKLIGEASLQDIRQGKVVGIKALDQLCSLLDLQPGDIIEYRKEE